MKQEITNFIKVEKVKGISESPDFELFCDHLEISELNTKGELVKKTYCRENGYITMIEEFNKGQLVKFFKYEYYNNNISYICEYNEKEEIVKSTRYFKDGNIAIGKWKNGKNFKRLTYNKKGELVDETKFLEYGYDKIDYIAEFNNNHLVQIIYYENFEIVIIKEYKQNDIVKRAVFKHSTIKYMEENDKEYKKTLYNDDGTIKYFKRY